MARRRQLVNRLLLVIFGLAVGLVAAEVGLRLAGFSTPQPYAPDPICGVRLRPGFRGVWNQEGRRHIVVNSYGFQHGSRTPGKPPGVFRVAVLGDSFVEAFQVEPENDLCAVLEDALQDCEAIEDRRVEALNFGVSGYGTAQSLLMLKHYVWEYEPDVVVLAFFAGNDVRNNSATLETDKARPFYHLENGQLVLDRSFHGHPDFVRARSWQVRLKIALLDHFRTLQLLRHVKNRQAADEQARPPQTEATETGVDLTCLAPPRDGDWQHAWELTERLLLEMKAETKQHGASFFIATVSLDVQVHPDESVRRAIQRRLAVDDLLYPEQRIQQFGERHAIEVVPLASDLQQYAAEHDAFLHGFDNTRPGYGHWNAAGHRLAGERIAEAICTKLTNEREIAGTNAKTKPASVNRPAIDQR